MYLRGERVLLRPLEPQDLPALVKWGADPVLAGLMEGAYPPDLAEAPAWLARLRANRYNQRFAILTAAQHLIGDVELDHIAWRSGHAELRVCIGEREWWNQGYGTDAVRTLVRYGFEHLGLRVVYLRVDRGNARAVRCYEKCGFRKEGWLIREGARGTRREILLMQVTPASLVVSSLPPAG